MNQRNNSPLLTSKQKNLILLHKRINPQNERQNLLNENTKYQINKTENILEKILLYNNTKKIKTMIKLEKIIYKKLNKSYFHNDNFYNIKKINEIISNQNTHIVAEYKDYLIKGDLSEFLQKYYFITESNECLPKIFEYYENCSIIFPNYVVLPESKYIFKNIQKKQKIIDKIQLFEEEKEKYQKGLIKIEDNDLVLNTNVIDSILEQTDTSGIKNFFGLKNDSSKNISIDNIINKINNAEKQIKSIKDRKTNCALKKNKIVEKKFCNYNININKNNYKIKGRNYNRYLDNGFNGSSNNKSKKTNKYTGLNINSTTSNGMKNTKISSTTIDMDSKYNNNNVIQNNTNNSNTIYICSNSKNHNTNNKNNTININNSIRKQNLVTNLLNNFNISNNNNNKDFGVKLFKEIKNIDNNNKNNNSINYHKNFSRNFSPSEKSTSKTRISTSIKHQTQLSSSSSPNSKINSYNKKNVTKESKMTKPKHRRVLSYNFSNKNKNKNYFLKNNKRKEMPLTERDIVNKNSFTPDIIQFITNQLNNLNNSNKKSLNAKNKKLESKDNKKKLIKKNKRNLNNIDNNSLLYPINNNINTNNSNNNTCKTQMKNEKTKFYSISPNRYLDNNKILKTCNFSINNEKTRKNYIVNKSNYNMKEWKKTVFNQKDIKGITIKGFKEILHSSISNSRNISNSERIIFNEGLTNKMIKTNRSNINNKYKHYDKTYLEMIYKINKKK